MKIVEIVLIVLVIVGLVLKYLFLPGGDQMLMISITLLSTLYFALGFMVLNQVGARAAFKGGLKNVAAVKLTCGAIAGLGLSILWIGTLFKLLELTGANDMLLIGSVLNFVMLLVFVVFYMIYKDKASAYTVVRLLSVGAIGIFLLFTSQMTLVRWQYRNHPAYVRAAEEYYKNPQVDSLLEKRELEYFRVRMPKDAFEKYEKDYNARRK